MPAPPSAFRANTNDADSDRARVNSHSNAGIGAPPPHMMPRPNQPQHHEYAPINPMRAAMIGSSMHH
eukprot:CAMPEP_0202687042 /NCGR_PEP_ID=MMETSP1385-20130828/2754_1 /ASSEMBLY_ACC=CAM_ASM_000861 /TAXON_ID=933848 /ORGANISM="Elphidium margaritaceum" /LENGTH=66 /DNA_ID=CAMNT_0049341755 /DNA_START=321 /DNA_END=521 /DNA_ORIENTATION=-